MSRALLIEAPHAARLVHQAAAGGAGARHDRSLEVQALGIRGPEIRRAARVLDEAVEPARAQLVSFQMARQAMDGAQEVQRSGARRTPVNAPQERRSLASAGMR